MIILSSLILIIILWFVPLLMFKASLLVVSSVNVTKSLSQLLSCPFFSLYSLDWESENKRKHHNTNSHLIIKDKYK